MLTLSEGISSRRPSGTSRSSPIWCCSVSCWWPFRIDVDEWTIPDATIPGTLAGLFSCHSGPMPYCPSRPQISIGSIGLADVDVRLADFTVMRSPRSAEQSNRLASRI